MSTKGNARKLICDSCGGLGQVSFFKGVSRFLVSNEECWECSGLGYIFANDEIADQTDGSNEIIPKSSKER